MKVRKKPVVVEAMCWDERTPAIDIIDWVLENGGTAKYFCVDAAACIRDDHTIAIKTIENQEDEYMHAQRGYWIIKGVDGEFYPCEPSIFDKTYDKVED